MFSYATETYDKRCLFNRDKKYMLRMYKTRNHSCDSRFDTAFHDTSHSLGYNYIHTAHTYILYNSHSYTQPSDYRGGDISHRDNSFRHNNKNNHISQMRSLRVPHMDNRRTRQSHHL
jgi:hypothetical protein